MGKNIVDNNGMIAEFMGLSKSVGISLADTPIDIYDRKNKQYSLWELKYHYKIGWLMPVVLKIEAMGYLTQIEMISTNINRVCFNRITGQEVCNGARSDSKIEAIYLAVTEFINWHNSQNK